MNKIILALLSSLFILSIPLMATDTDIHTDVDSLPSPAKELLHKHFQDENIVAVTQNRENKCYEVRTHDGKRFDFTESGEWYLLDCNKEEVPFLLIPKKIRTHIAKKYGPYVHAVEIKRSKKGHKVELNNQIELIFKN